MTTSDTPRVPDTIKLIHQLSLVLAQHTATHADRDDLARLMEAIDGKTNSTIIVFAAVTLKQIIGDMAEDDRRPKELTPELISPVLLAAVSELIHGMTIIRTPIPPEDLH